jgi:3-oxoacyl-[acyl-carrier-protein] synthase II
VSKRRVVVTGIGLITPLGLDRESTWDGIKHARSGIVPITSFDATDYSTRIAGEVKDFEPTKFMSAKEVRKTSLFIQYAIGAGLEAIEHSGLVINEHNAKRVGVAIGSGIGGLALLETTALTIQERGPRKVSPFFITGSIINMASGDFSVITGAKGPNIAMVSACTTGCHNIGVAARLIQYGDADVMIAGGTESAITHLGVGGFAAARALSQRNDEPAKACRPWDKDRDGFVQGDGAGVLVLEEYETAKRRGANILAELIGFGMSGDAYHKTLPCEDGQGFVDAIERAIEDAQIPRDTIQYINAHATSTSAGDVLEALAVKRVFGHYAYKLPVSSTKSMTGHLLGAAGAIEAAFSILALRDQVLPPTINLDNPDEGCDLDFVPHTARDANLTIVASNSFGFGGTNGCLIFKKL